MRDSVRVGAAPEGTQERDREGAPLDGTLKERSQTKEPMKRTHAKTKTQSITNHHPRF